MEAMSDSKVQQEPSIEEILSSIRQIINEDGEGGDGAGAAAVPPHPSPMAGNEDDVLDLANIAKPALNIPPAPPAVEVSAPVEETTPDIDLDFDDKKVEEPMQSDDIDAMFDTPVQPPIPAPVPVEDSGEGIVAEDVLSAAAASLSRLAQAEVMIDRKHAAGMGSVTLEDVVKEMLRPMMKSWLDENLPPLVERLVQKEIQKISSRL